MKGEGKRAMADVPDGAGTPLEAAVRRRDASVLDTVARAVAAGEVMLAYQPVMQARAPFETGFYEGLIRVLDPTGRVIPARDFMATLEETELGRELDCAALRLGLKALEGNSKLRLSINMSARSIGYKTWRRILDRFLARDATLGERLILEISEASVMRVPELVADFIDDLRPLGIAFAIDEFGSGDIAPRHFRNLLFDAVKLDPQYVRGLDRDPDTAMLARALVAMARPMDLAVIAVAVETQAEAEMLAQMGVDCLQGYLFGAPTVRPPWLNPKSEAAA